MQWCRKCRLAVEPLPYNEKFGSYACPRCKHLMQLNPLNAEHRAQLLNTEIKCKNFRAVASLIGLLKASPSTRLELAERIAELFREEIALKGD